MMVLKDIHSFSVPLSLIKMYFLLYLAIADMLISRPPGNVEL